MYLFGCILWYLTPQRTGIFLATVFSVANDEPRVDSLNNSVSICYRLFL